MKDLSDYEVSLILKNINNTATSSDKHELETWILSSTENKQAYEQFLKLWELTEDTAKDFNIDANAAWTNVKAKAYINTQEAKIIKFNKTKLTLSIAASIVLLIGLSWLFKRNFIPQETVLVKTANEKKLVTLPDKSTAYLNANSCISYSKDFEERKVTLNGHAFFNVMKDSLHPFTVINNLSQVTVLGTSFTIHSYKANQIETVEVFTGKVACSSKARDAKKVIIYPGYIASITTDGNIITKKADSDNAVALKKSKFNFNNAKLSEVVRSLQKNFGVTITLSNKKLSNCRYTGSFENDAISDIIEIIALSMNLTYQKQEGVYILQGETCP